MRFSEADTPSVAQAEAMVRENVSGHVDADWSEQGKQRLLNALRLRRQGATGVSRRVVLTGALLGAGTAASAYAWRQRGSSPLSYVVTGGLASENGYVHGSSQSGSEVTFSDGSRVDLQEGARARIADVDSHGAQIVIESGRIALNLVHRPHAVWYVNAGPFVARVTGAQFEVYWSSYDECLSVTAFEGNIIVSGPLTPSGVPLPAGRRLTGSEGRVTIDAIEPVVQSAETVSTIDVTPLEPSLSESAETAAARTEPRSTTLTEPLK